ncbi:MAG: hypothetical protein RQ824_10500 [bacterium]|nr:hypothetical protein [bacterium]
MRHSGMMQIEIKIRYIDPHPGEKDKVEEAYVVWGKAIDIHEIRKFTTDQNEWTGIFPGPFGIRACIAL